MSNVTNIEGELDRRRRRIGGPVDSGGGGPHDPLMEERVKKLEATAEKTVERLIRIEERLGTFATKEDLHKEISTQTWRLVTFVCSFGTALVAATYFIVTHSK